MQRSVAGARPADLAARLAAADDAERAALLARVRRGGAPLARALRSLYLDSVAGDPARARGAAAALAALAARAGTADHAEVAALAAWITGLAALQLDGQLERAVALLDEAAARFTALAQPLDAAATQVGKVAALAMLGRYEAAIRCGLAARDVFVAGGDSAAAGRIEQNLGNIHWRRDRYQEAERFYRAARDRYLALNAAGPSIQGEIATIDNNLATTLISQHRFREAARLYEQALERAEAAGLEATRAMIERNLGWAALFQGRYGDALDYLERSRRRYAALGMAHRSAGTEQELADAYLDLNLAPEAAAIYERVIPTFATLGMRAEQAAALAALGYACLSLSRPAEARTRLAEARALYAAEGNVVGEAAVTLTEAQQAAANGDYVAAEAGAARAATALATAGSWRRLLPARWLRGEAARLLGRTGEARELLSAALREAEQRTAPQVAARCHTSLGLLAAAVGDQTAAEAGFRQAIAVTEDLRAPLPAEEFRTAFIADKLTPYAEMVRLCLADPGRTAEALDYVERARSRALVEVLGGALPVRARAKDSFESGLVSRLDELREELNWLYSRINRPPEGGPAPAAESMEALQAAVQEREAAVLEIMRQLRQRGDGATGQAAPFDLAGLQRRLGSHTALVEYYSLDGELLAFVVTGAGIEIVRGLGAEARVEAALGQLRFQIETLRYGADRVRTHLDQLNRRAQHYLGVLYDLVLRPIESRLGGRRLVVVPHRALHYVPFHALHDGAAYVIERREVVYAPSAAVLDHCLAAARRPLERALLLGVPDERAPRVRDEVAALAPLFPEAVALLDDTATPAALRRHAPAADVVHLACHGHFRPDNPLFSSLRLAGGWLTVRDACDLDLTAGLVTLSACETGVSAVAPGDELIGLARGFFSAGAPSLLVSLWTVDDESTATLMAGFYRRLRAGDTPAAALRAAQRDLMARYPHPFYWSAFVLLGRW